jgi:PAS domain S-box-containing protein
MTQVVPDVSTGIGRTRRTPRPHSVQFYESDEFLGQAVARFVAEGLRADEPAIVIATKPHRELFMQRLGAEGIDAGREVAVGRLVLLDASDTLQSFMVDGAPDRERCFSTLGPLLDRLCQLSSSRRIRAFGEMVDLLWRSGQRSAALQLEELWNELATRHDFALLCAYVMDSFFKQSGVSAICARHSHVLVPELRTGQHEDSPVIEGNVQALVHEIAKRTELEIALRESLQSLRETKEDLQDVLENAAIPIHRVDRNGIIRWANKAELHLLGYTRAEYVGHHISEFHADQDKIADILARLLRGEVLHNYEAPLIAKDGTTRWVELSSNMQTGNGELDTTRCFCRDITAQKEAELDRDAIYRATKALADELDLDKLVAKLLREVQQLSRAERVQFLEGGRNDELAAMASYFELPLVAPSGELLGALACGDPKRGTFTPRIERLLTAVGAHASSALANAKLYAGERYARAAAEKGERRTALLYQIAESLSRALSSDEVCRIVISAVRPLLGAQAASVLIVDPSGARAERLLVDGEFDAGSAARLQSERLEPGIPVADAALTGKVCWVAGGAELDRQFPNLSEIRLTIGAQTWGGIPIAFEGRTLGAMGFRCSRVRPLEPDEETLLLAIGRQCGLALERARLHEKMEVARREAEQGSRAKDEFLAMLGHELRNPLSPILTAVQLMRVRGDQTSIREQNVIERQVTHLIHLVDDLLDISRITRGKVQLDKRPQMLASLVTKSIEIAGPLCEEHRHHVSVDIPVETIWLEADETRLCQVITNLVSNAAKYTPPGGRIVVSAKRAGNKRVRISVKDNGRGIDSQLLPRVFELFVQGERKTDRSQGGLGIGLAIVRNLVALHGGTVSAHSDGVGRGSEFVVELPVVDLQAKPSPERSVRQGVQVTPRKILVVDDNEDAGALLGEMLQSLGHEVVVALDGPRALEAVERFAPEIGILDIGLPVMDGYELAAALRQRFGSAIRLMAVTGYGQEQDRRRTQEAGFEQHFVKPVGLGKVLAAIEVRTQQT